MHLRVVGLRLEGSPFVIVVIVITFVHFSQHKACKRGYLNLAKWKSLQWQFLYGHGVLHSLFEELEHYY